jgi:AcrR family transcriptional regulator
MSTGGRSITARGATSITDTANAIDDAPPRRTGRPRLADAEALAGRIVDVATALFLTEGYGATSIEEVARQAGVSKRTFYSRFPDKPAVFRAVVHHVLEHLRPADFELLFVPGPLEIVLPTLARAILTATLDPWALALHRLTVAESARFPDIAETVRTEGGGEEAVRRIASLLAGDSAPDAATWFAAAQFLAMVVSVPQRRGIGPGPRMTESEQEEWCDRTVRLFLAGWKAG